MGEKKSLLSRIVTWTVLAILAVIALRLALRVVGAVFGLVAFVLFTIGPIALFGWIALKAWKAFSKPAV